MYFYAATDGHYFYSSMYTKLLLFNTDKYQGLQQGVTCSRYIYVGRCLLVIGLRFWKSISVHDIKVQLFPRSTRSQVPQCNLQPKRAGTPWLLCVSFLRRDLLLFVYPWSLKKINFRVVSNIISLMAHSCNKTLMQVISSVAQYIVNNTGILCNNIRLGRHDPANPSDSQAFGWLWKWILQCKLME